MARRLAKEVGNASARARFAESPGDRNRCELGHEFTEWNTVRDGDGVPTCRACAIRQLRRTVAKARLGRSKANLAALEAELQTSLAELRSMLAEFRDGHVRDGEQ